MAQVLTAQLWMPVHKPLHVITCLSDKLVVDYLRKDRVSIPIELVSERGHRFQTLSAPISTSRDPGWRQPARVRRVDFLRSLIKPYVPKPTGVTTRRSGALGSVSLGSGTGQGHPTIPSSTDCPLSLPGFMAQPHHGALISKIYIQTSLEGIKSFPPRDSPLDCPAVGSVSFALRPASVPRTPPILIDRRQTHTASDLR